MWHLVLHDVQGAVHWKSQGLSEGRFGELMALCAHAPDPTDCLRRPPPCRFASHEIPTLFDQWAKARAYLASHRLDGIALDCPGRPGQVLWQVYAHRPVLSAPGVGAYIERPEGTQVLRVVVDDPDYPARIEAWLLRRIAKGGPRAVAQDDPQDPQPVESTTTVLPLPCAASQLVRLSESFSYAFRLAGYEPQSLGRVVLRPLVRAALEEYSEAVGAWDDLLRVGGSLHPIGEISISR